MNTRRRFFIASCVGLVLPALPCAAIAQQQGKIWRIGFLSQQALETFNYGAFQDGMRELGYVEGRNVHYEARYVAGKFEQVPAVAAELLQLKVDAIVVGGGATLGVKAATRTVPIIMVNVADPVSRGLVASLARPGGNITGISSISWETGLKRLDLLITAIPKLSRVAVLFNPTNDNQVPLKVLQESAKKAGVQLMPIEARTWKEIEKAFPVMVGQRAQALLTMSDGLFGTHRRQIAELAAKTRLPSAYETEPYAEFGGLMSYGQDNTTSFRRAAIFVDKILKGAKPGDLPVEQPTKLNLVLNMKAARALGITFPREVMVLADGVIE